MDDTTQRREVLDEAVHVAKDFVGDTDRTIGYMLELHRLSPGDSHLPTQLERLLERQGRSASWRRCGGPATQRWRGRGTRPAGAPGALTLERLNDPAARWPSWGRCWRRARRTTAACELAERILRLPAAPSEVRGQALALLRARYEASGRSASWCRCCRRRWSWPAPASGRTCTVRLPSG